MSEPVERTEKASRLAFIEGMRGLAAFYVVLQHCVTMVDPYQLMLRANAHPSWLREVFLFLLNGHFAVSAFIVLSGFCLQLALYQKGDGQLRDVRTFFFRRFWRILPPYYACLAFSLLVCHFVTSRQEGMPWVQYLPVTWENTLAHIFMIHNLSRDWMYKINGVLWSISIEFQLYLVFPLFVVGLWRWGSRVMIPLMGSLVAVLMVASPASEKLYPWYAALFVLGMCGARWALEPSRAFLHRWFLAGSVLFLVAALWSTQYTKELVVRDALMGVSVTLALALGTARPDHLWVRPFAFGPLVGLGAFSYSLYLMHHPILQIIYLMRPEWVSTPLRSFAYLLIVGVPIILVLCYAFYRVFEKPFIGRRPRKKLPPQTPAPSPARD